MIHSIENEFLKVSAETSGAQLSSIMLKDGRKEFLWQGDVSVWYGRAPVLFPVIGQLLDSKYRYDGKEYEMPKHGFARHSEFKLKEISEKSMTFSLCSSNETKKCYPFDFELLIKYTVCKNAVRCTSTVINNTDGEMFFSLGAHPGFNCNIGSTIEFDKAEQLRTLRIDSDSILMDETFPVEWQDEKTIKITEHTFDEDALIFASLNSESLTLTGNDRKIKFTYGKVPYFGIWAKPNAPYVCLEPWFGVNDSYDKKASIAEKQGIVRLEKGENFAFDWTAELEG